MLFVAFVWTCLLILPISRIVELSESEVTVETVSGSKHTIRLTEIVDLMVVSMGWFTHVLMKTKTQEFWSFRKTLFRFPVRGRYSDQQGSLTQLIGMLDPSIVSGMTI